MGSRKVKRRQISGISLTGEDIMMRVRKAGSSTMLLKTASLRPASFLLVAGMISRQFRVHRVRLNCGCRSTEAHRPKALREALQSCVCRYHGTRSSIWGAARISTPRHSCYRSMIKLVAYGSGFRRERVQATNVCQHKTTYHTLYLETSQPFLIE